MVKGGIRPRNQLQRNNVVLAANLCGYQILAERRQEDSKAKAQTRTSSLTTVCR